MKRKTFNINSILICNVRYLFVLRSNQKYLIKAKNISFEIETDAFGLALISIEESKLKKISFVNHEIRKNSRWSCSAIHVITELDRADKRHVSELYLLNYLHNFSKSKLQSLRQAIKRYSNATTESDLFNHSISFDDFITDKTINNLIETRRDNRKNAAKNTKKYVHIKNKKIVNELNRIAFYKHIHYRVSIDDFSETMRKQITDLLISEFKSSTVLQTNIKKENTQQSDSIEYSSIKSIYTKNFKARPLEVEIKENSSLNEYESTLNKSVEFQKLFLLRYDKVLYDKALNNTFILKKSYEELLKKRHKSHQSTTIRLCDQLRAAA